MNLRNGNITVGEVWRMPKARQQIIQAFPVLAQGIPPHFYSLTLNQAMHQARALVPKRKIDCLYRALESH